MIFELAERFLGLTFQRNEREDGDRITQLRRVQFGVIALDDAGFLERANPAQARRRGQPDARGQFHVGHPAFVLQLGQQPAIDLIKVGHLPNPWLPNP